MSATRWILAGTAAAAAVGLAAVLVSRNSRRVASIGGPNVVNQPGQVPRGGPLSLFTGMVSGMTPNAGDGRETAKRAGNILTASFVGWLGGGAAGAGSGAGLGAAAGGAAGALGGPLGAIVGAPTGAAIGSGVGGVAGSVLGFGSGLAKGLGG